MWFNTTKYNQTTEKVFGIKFKINEKSSLAIYSSIEDQKYRAIAFVFMGKTLPFLKLNWMINDSIQPNTTKQLKTILTLSKIDKFLVLHFLILR